MALAAIPAKALVLSVTTKQKIMPKQKLLTTGTIQDYWRMNDERGRSAAMRIKMTIDECLEFADEWSRGLTLYEGAQGWRVVCMLLAEEVKRLRPPPEPKDNNGN